MKAKKRDSFIKLIEEVMDKRLGGPDPYPQETEELTPYDVAKLEMSVHGIETALTGVELALTPTQKKPIQNLLDQIRVCSILLKEEMNLNVEDE